MTDNCPCLWMPATPRRRWSRGRVSALMLMWTLVVVGPVGAGAIYKSVDADGRVTYAAQPPAQDRGPAVELRIRTGPEPATVGTANQTKAVVPPPAPNAGPAADQGARLGAGHAADNGPRPGVSRAADKGAGQKASQSSRRFRDAQLTAIRAKAELEQAKIHSADDWQTTPGGDQVSTLDYERRVSEAQAKVRTADAALERLRKR